MRKPAKKTNQKPVRKTAKKPLKAVKKKPAKMRRPSPKNLPPRLAAVVPEQDLEAPKNYSQSSDRRLPLSYGEDKLVLLVRDPWWLFTYWEVTPGRREEAERELRHSGHRQWKTVLRVFDVTQSSLSKSRSFFDIELNFYTDNWYVDVGLPDREWMAQIGLRTADGVFFALVTSNRVRTPSFGISDVLDEEWMLPEEVYYRLIGVSGLNAQQGSGDIRKILEKYLKRLVSSGSFPQVSIKS